MSESNSTDTSADSALSWAAPNLIAGKGKAADILAGLTIAIGAVTDTVAFQNTLKLLLPHETDQVRIMLMAVGATAMGLVAAAFFGIAYSIHRRDQPGSSRLLRNFAAGAWLGLGIMMLLVRLFTPQAADPASGGFDVSSSAGSPALTAGFFFSIYVVSGAGTVFEADRLYNPVYFAYVRLRKLLRKQEAVVVLLEAELERARAVADLLAGDLDREDHRKRAAILERQAFGAEIANLARVLMAVMLQDPAKTGLAETGPVAELPEFPGAA
jgi:hypothetical protein